jgi:hypothetical protein
MDIWSRLTRKDYSHEWYAAPEKSEARGEYLHVFILVNTSRKQAQSILNGFDDGWLAMDASSAS